MKGIVYGGLLSVVFVLSGCSGSQKEGRDSKEIPVEIVKVAKTVPADTRNYVGTVEEVVSSSISFQVMGNVERVLVGEGQKVREGQLLAVKTRRRWKTPITPRQLPCDKRRTPMPA